MSFETSSSTESGSLQPTLEAFCSSKSVLSADSDDIATICLSDSKATGGGRGIIACLFHAMVRDGIYVVIGPLDGEYKAIHDMQAILIDLQKQFCYMVTTHLSLEGFLLTKEDSWDDAISMHRGVGQWSPHYIAGSVCDAKPILPFSPTDL